MADKKGRRQFGSVRKLPSGRYQVRYLAPDGLQRTGDRTFANKTDAQNWLTVQQSQLLRGEWTDPLLGKVSVREYGERWIEERTIAHRTREQYRWLMRAHIGPTVGDRELGSLTTEIVRSWRHNLLASGRSEMTTAKAYRLLRAILNTAVDDGRLKRNPCRVKGADQEKSPERPVATVGQVYAVADAMPTRYRAFVLAAAFTGLRWGELIGLTRSDVDLDRGTLRVRRSLVQLNSGQLVSGPTKSTSGVRTVSIPAVLLPDLHEHLDSFVGSEADALLFTTPAGTELRRNNWRRDVHWRKKLTDAGLPEGFHFHDLRHTGNHLASMSGASTRELMHRMGHGTVRAALIYQHATSERDRQIADAVSAFVEAQRKPDDRPDSAADGDA